MSVASVRAQAIATILWELKKAGKLASLTSIATRVGFSPGSNGRTVSTSLKTVRRDWPHLEWWRAVADNGVVDEEQQSILAEAGFELEPADDGMFAIVSLETHQMTWEDSCEAVD